MTASTKIEQFAWEGGRCRVPMWGNSTPAGFCEEVAFGPQYPAEYLEWSRSYRRAPYCFGPCCSKHGGPKAGEPILFRDGTDERGRPMWCAVKPGFQNLQESAAGFSASPVQAVVLLAQDLAAQDTTDRQPQIPGGRHD